MCEKYRQQFEAEFGDTVAMVELTLLDTWAFAYAQHWIEQDLCKSIPANKQVMLFYSCTFTLDYPQ